MHTFNIGTLRYVCVDEDNYVTIRDDTNGKHAFFTGPRTYTRRFSMRWPWYLPTSCITSVESGTFQSQTKFQSSTFAIWTTLYDRHPLDWHSCIVSGTISRRPSNRWKKTFLNLPPFRRAGITASVTSTDAVNALQRLPTREQLLLTTVVNIFKK